MDESVRKQKPYINYVEIICCTVVRQSKCLIPSIQQPYQICLFYNIIPIASFDSQFCISRPVVSAYLESASDLQGL